MIGTGRIQIGGPLARGQLQRGVKEGHFAIGRGVYKLLDNPLYNQYNQTAN